MKRLNNYRPFNVLKNLTAVMLLSVSAYSETLPKSAVRSNSEGALSSNHVQDLAVYRKKFFYDDLGKISLPKVALLQKFLNEQKNQLLNSAKLNKKTNLIYAHGYEQAEAEKKGQEALNEEAEAIAPILFAEEQTADLVKNLATLSDAQIHERVETILLFLAAGYTVYPEGVFTSAVDRAKSLARNFFDFNKNDRGQIQASNLIGEKGFLTAKQIADLQAQGEDISKIDPPSSAFWTNNDIENYDPNNETYFDIQMFPSKDIAIPEFTYKRMGNGNIKIKTEWLDKKDLNDKGEPKKKDVTLRLGHEAYAAGIAGHLARIVGYPAIPNTFRSKIKLNLGDISYEQFVKEWINAHGSEQGSVLTHVERIAGQNAVYIKNANLEAYPKENQYRKMGPFRMGDNGFNNRREYRAMVLFNALISLEDQFEYQSRVDAYRDNKKAAWQPLFFIADTGQSLGLPTWGNTGTVNEYAWNFTWTDDNQVKLFWLSIFNSRTWEKTTYSDVKWMARRIARISSQQIDELVRASGIPEAAGALYAEKIKSRINKMMKDFNLDKEGFNSHKVLSKFELAQKYPTYISPDGHLKDGVQQLPNNTVPLLGNQFTPYQYLKSTVINLFSEALGKIITQEVLTEKITSGGLASFNLGNLRAETGDMYEASRDVSVNNEVGGVHKRYLIKDKLSVGVPIGFDNKNLKTPASIYYVFSYEYIHSVDTLKETATENFFKKLNPFELDNIRRELKQGEQLKISHAYGASIGEVRLKLIEDLQIDAAIVGLSQNKIKSMSFTKSNDLLEALVTHHTDRVFSTGLDVTVAVRVAMMYRKAKTNNLQNYYKLDLLGANAEQAAKMNAAFNKALVENDFSDLNQITTPTLVNESTRTKSLNLGLFLWNRDSQTTTSEVTFDKNSFVLANRTYSRDRSFDRLWNDKSNAGISIVNFFGNLTNENKLMDVAFEGTVNSEKSGFNRMEVNISFAHADRYTTKEDFYKEFTKYFNERSGEKDYIDFKVPAQIDQYLDLAGLMRWQLSGKALSSLLNAISNKQNLSHLNCHSGVGPRQVSYCDVLSMRAARLLVDLQNAKETKSSKKLRKLGEQIVDVIIGFIGTKGQNVALIRNHVSDKDIWVVTKIEEMIDQSHPTFRLRNDYWAKEIGQFQGHTDLSKLRRNKLTQPIIAH